MYNCMFVSALPDPTCNSEKSTNDGNKQILLLLLLLLLLLCTAHMGSSTLVWLIEKKQLDRFDAENTVGVVKVQRFIR